MNFIEVSNCRSWGVGLHITLQKFSRGGFILQLGDPRGWVSCKIISPLCSPYFPLPPVANVHVHYRLSSLCPPFSYTLTLPCIVVSWEHCHPLHIKLAALDAASSSAGRKTLPVSLQGITTPLKLEYWHQQLGSHPDGKVAQLILKGIEQDFLAVSAEPTSAILPKANSVAMYLETTSGWLLVDNMFPLLLQSWEELCWNPILNPWHPH